MGYQQEWVDGFDEASEFDLVDSAEENGEDDPEAYTKGESAVPEEANEADAAEQHREVPPEDEEPRAE